MAGKKPTITCKVCGGEHSGTICAKYTTVRVVPVPQSKRLALPAPKKAKKAKKVKARRAADLSPKD